MSSLVADYGSDYTDSDEDYLAPEKDDDDDEEIVERSLEVLGDERMATITKNIEQINECREESNVKTEVDPEGSDSEDQSSGEEEVPQQVAKTRLPNPLVGIFAAQDDPKMQVQHSVFSTEYDAVEAAKRSVLERHVKLTDEEIEKKKMLPLCLKFKKGKCRFGARCKWRHEKNGTVDVPAAVATNIFVHQPKFLRGPGNLHVMPDPVDDDSYMGQAQRKRRYGVGDTLVPPKRALNDLNRMRSKDRPWTMNSGAT